ncbi:integrase catalytic domain-containing protein [Trichonephila inaurata madagascariensis]|uniref:Integrase catalytic domain-containing protein n=1 Tax=Trichonephila inaurata madagascariensis TaxID=2747483 RepID=A0A8X6M6M9_9ARAC|nr:integrase catalytic domain-containing protein [Trichonephila inaurata madagascariensis]
MVRLLSRAELGSWNCSMQQDITNFLKNIDLGKNREFCIKKKGFPENSVLLLHPGGRIIEEHSEKSSEESLFKRRIGHCVMQRRELNLRPLTYLSKDLDELSALTPSMFLQEIRKVEIPDVDMIDSKRLNKRCAYRQKLRQDLRNRFRNEYIGILKDYSKFKGESFIRECVGSCTNWRYQQQKNQLASRESHKDV